MFEEILPYYIVNPLNKLNFSQINEIRLRANKPILINCSGNYFYLTSNGVSNELNNVIVCDKEVIQNLLKVVSNNSFYSINEQLLNGFVSYRDGIRIGVAGEVVSENGKLLTIKNITSLNIRIPHIVKNCSLSAYNYIIKNDSIYSTLIISAPGAGKTTFIRDLINQITSRNKNISVLVVDERLEISGNNNLLVGNNIDIILNCNKKFAFDNGIRSLNPDVIVTDEINLSDDLLIIERALTSGVKVVATIHAQNINELKNKKELSALLKLGLFERFVVLNKRFGPGSLEGVYNENLSCIYCEWN